MSERITTETNGAEQGEGDYTDAWHLRAREIGDELRAEGNVEPTDEDIAAARAQLEEHVAMYGPDMFGIEGAVQELLDDEESLKIYTTQLVFAETVVGRLTAEGLTPPSDLND